MFCCGCERKFDHRKTKKIVITKQLIANVCPRCGSEDIFTDKDMAQWRRAEAKRKKEEQAAADARYDAAIDRML